MKKKLLNWLLWFLVKIEKIECLSVQRGDILVISTRPHTTCHEVSEISSAFQVAFNDLPPMIFLRDDIKIKAIRFKEEK